MTHSTSMTLRRAAGIALAAGAASLLAGCGGVASNRSLYSVHQPVVERTNYTFDVTTGAGGLTYSEQKRLSDWFDAMDLRYGDRVSVDDPLDSATTLAAVEALTARRGVLMSDEAPETPGYVDAGVARIVLTRSRATVPGCPDWTSRNDSNLGNATSSNYGCATNSNLAVMVADPEHLIKGAEATGETVVMSSTKAITSYRDMEPTGAGGLKAGGAKE